ncbi:MAG: sarcosine oxidase subunit gamma [Hoeflea sp.]|uniref:sarcosine oxidase subunit gamma n=1 Tax=Hoeflea sp. TaxID=1940281 RepID=UPI001D9F4283|nr:sarcosine oxidase subunit gamma [Hoeflea sp.]MBU4528208.1 sarcosine oxidase subunit gamma [Alphaproteobacteria bacterium]MBU4543804.1 sarcosine oxidase subunit gamma [Alphaproteobacteria bacterium]MBU4548445.1 sarcosine oxidase subunit gamma [Alphaproteobacteria bacterium]MBV1722524.1 sarcosine oxidase subunit gamma [Hoeflea sp.]MBV1762193.1 sarcosine oxidase subunit gamma [Hoeflea sp.]
MAKSAQAVRTEPLAGRVSGSAGVQVTPAAAAVRVSLRADPENAKALSKALGLELPLKPKTTAGSLPGRLVAWLGPDEWLIIDETGDPLSDLRKAKVLHSAVDVSHRNTAILVSGKGARATLESGCPQNLGDAVFPVGAASRTVMGKIEVVIIRTADTEYRVECWRSFSTYAFDFLSESAKDCLA